VRPGSSETTWCVIIRAEVVAAGVAHCKPGSIGVLLIFLGASAVSMSGFGVLVAVDVSRKRTNR
jgi:hypothetical protein